MQLPFTLPPYPDEILGSWLARNELHNGRGAWLGLLRELDTGLNAPKVFDIPDYSPGLVALVKALGAPCYEHVLLNLTTLPYWLAFDAAPPEQGILSGTENLPLLYGQNGQLIQNPRHIIKHYRSQVGIRYCPVCLTSDIRAVGEPYWHRVHQLPNVTVCPEHQVCLLSSCVRCGRSCAPQLGSRLLLPWLTCICGYDLSAAIRPSGLDEVRVKLVKVSVDALRSGVPTYDRSRLHGFLLSKAGIARQKQIVAEAYGGYATRSSGAEKELVSNVRWVWFPHYRAMCEARAVNLCALLAALDLPNPKEADLAERWPQVPTVGRARVFMLRHARLFPGARPSRGTGIHYWVLRLLDPNWLTRHFRGKKAVPAPPSISEDRAWIKQYMAGKRRRKEVRTDQRTLLVRSAAFLRAQVRDQSWLRNECPDIAWSHRPRDRITSDKSRKSTRRAPPPMTVKHVRALRDAFRAALLEEGYPAPLTVTELAARARLGYDNAKKALRHDPRFQVEIQHARGELRHRRILWAAHELQVRDGPMTVTAIASCAHIRNNKASSELIRRVLGDLVEKGN